MAIQWTMALSVGVDVIDDQHKELFKRVNDLLEACNQRKGKDVVGEIINFLADYVVKHFKYEEGYMVKHGYPGYASHKSQHAEFINKFSELRGRFNDQGPGLPVILATNQLVVKWLTNHISKVDKELGAFLKTK